MKRRRDNFDVCNQGNPFMSTTTSVLVEILEQDIDLKALAAKELANRCRDMSGRYAGMKASVVALNAWLKQRGARS